ncbi:MAG: hypothetical protein U0996_11625 [Planctomycetaceae bacterium]
MRTILLTGTMTIPAAVSCASSKVDGEGEATMSFQNPEKWIRRAMIGLVYSAVGLMFGFILAAFGMPLAGMAISCMLIGAVVGIVIARSAG